MDLQHPARKNSVPAAGEPIEIKNSAGFAADVMDIRRLKQIWMAHHPEDKAAGDREETNAIT